MNETCNESTPSIGFDPDELHRRYLAERDKRLRLDGLAQYQSMDGGFASYAEDPYVTAEITRPRLNDSVDVAIVGGGFSGLITAGRLRQAGVEHIRVIEVGADFGGTWYWNRYPGVRCDVESYIYMPFLEELGYIPTEKYAGGEEIFAHCQAIARHFDLYANACLQTQVTRIEWDEKISRWVIHTDRADEMTARFVCLAGGALHRPKLPGIPGIEDFDGKSFHTSRWDYAYTRGDSSGGLTGLRNKRVGIIGTGATAIQCIPHLAAHADGLLIFQRTPSAVDARDNRPTDSAWAASLEPGWQRERMANFTAVISGIAVEENLVNDRWTDGWSRIRVMPSSEVTGVDPDELRQLADYEKMQEIRARVDSVVTDKATAESLKPWYNLWCKRPLFSDEYLQTFNRPNVHLIDTEGRGVDHITAKGVVVADTEYEVDCLIYATGFAVGVPPYEAGEYQVVGRGGLDLAVKWAKGCTSVHGLMTHGFPNLFVSGHACGAALSTNIPHALAEHAAHVVSIITENPTERVRTLEVRPEAEDAWAESMDAHAVDRSKFLEECTPGYINGEGQPDGPLMRTFAGGLIRYSELLESWRSDGMHKDLEITYE